MNDFGKSLPRGTRGLYKKAVFFDPKASDKERVFVMEAGPGMEPTPGSRKITGHWESDNVKDTLDSYSFESVMLDGKRVRQIITGDPPPEPVMKIEEPTPDEPQAKVRRKR